MAVNEAIRQCKEANLSFENVFRYQYVISPNEEEWPSFKRYQVGSQNVYTGTALQVTELFDEKGVEIGLCLGIAVHHDGTLIGLEPLKGLDSKEHDFFESFEKQLDLISGRYGFILHAQNSTRFYGDPVCMLGSVFAKESRRFAASPYLCIDRLVLPHPLYPEGVVEDRRGSYRFLHTYDAHVERLNPNHYFDFDKFNSVRYWPREDNVFETGPETYGDIIDEMIEASENIIGTMTQNFETSMPLTGGYDSRILLASAGKYQKNVTQYFTHINNYANRRDSFVANLIAKEVDVPFEVHDRKKDKFKPWVGRNAAASYQIGAGTNAPVPLELKNGLFSKVLKDSVVMRGHQTNIMRGQYVLFANKGRWKDPSWQIMNMAVVDKKNEFNDEVRDKFLPDFYKIYNDLPKNALERSADFMFLEGLVPNALGELFMGLSHAFYLSPFNSRRIIELSMRFDTTYRLSNKTTHIFIDRADARLNDVPYLSEIPADTKLAYEQEKTSKRIQMTMDTAAEVFGHKS